MRSDRGPDLRRFEVVYRDEFGEEGAVWRTAASAAEATATVPGAVRAEQVPSLWAPPLDNTPDRG